MQQAAGREFELPDRFTQLILNSFGRNMQAACDFFNGQSLFTAVLENHPAMVGNCSTSCFSRSRMVL